jgi:ABC-2 type transport system permease protein
MQEGMMRNNFGVVFRFEYLQQVRKKSFLISTAIFAVVIIVLGFLSPKLLGLAAGSTDSSTLEGGIYYGVPEMKGMLPFDDQYVYDSEEALRQAVERGDISVGYDIQDEMHLVVIYATYGMTDAESEGSNPVEAFMQEYHTTKRLQEEGVSPTEYSAILAEKVEVQRDVLETDSTSRYFINLFYIIIAYVVVLAYGQTVATAVAREKDTKTMELLITSTDPKSLILGKVFATMAVVVTALALYVICALIPYFSVRDRFPDFVQQLLDQTIPTSVLLVYLLFFLQGLLQYLFLFAALGCTVSRVEDVGSAVSSIILFILLAYTVAFVSLFGTDPAVVQIVSWIPFFSMLVMPIRYANGFVGLSSVVISLLISLAFTAFMAYLCVRIYRWGTLHYGKRTSLFKVIRKSFSEKS